jgi:hypothetical protein
MRENCLHEDLYGFAVELRQLAYTMPGGCEDPLLRLSERMISHVRRLPGGEETRQTG